jgi:YbbR domain-containing protein
MRKNTKKRKLYLKIFSLTFGLFIWLYVVSSAEVELDKVVPVTYKVESGKAIKTSVPSDIIFRVKGPRLFVKKLLERKDSILLDTRKSQFSFNIDKYKIKLPLGLELLDYSPRNIKLKVEREVSKVVPIKLHLDSKLSEKFDSKSLSYSPKKVEITGAKSLISAIKKVDTVVIEEINTANLNPVEIQLEGLGTNIKMKNSSVLLNYAEPLNKTEFTISEIPIIFQSSRLVKTRSAALVSIKIAGDKKLVQEISKESIQVFANIPNSGKSKIVIDLITELPPGIELIELYPKKVSLELESL